MAATPKLTVAAIRQLASADVFERGQEYYDGGAVLTLVRRGPILARVDSVEESFFEEAVEPGFARR